MTDTTNQQSTTEGPTTEPTTAARGRRQVLTGTVVSTKNAKTVTVAVETRFMHPLYKRYIKRTSRFAAHDEHGTCGDGDRVTIVSCRPMSRTKRWRVSEIVQKAGSVR